MKKQPILLVLAMMLFVAYGMAQMQPSTGPTTGNPQSMPGQQDPTANPQTGYPGDTTSRGTTDNTQTSDKMKVSDPELQSAVQSKLSGDPAFSGVQSTVEDGKVKLTGTVSSKDEKKRLKKEIKSIAGVRGIKNDVTVDENRASANSSQGSAGAADNNAQANTAGSISGNSQSSASSQATSPGATETGAAESSQTGSQSVQHSEQAGAQMPQSDSAAQTNSSQANSSAAGTADDSAQLQQRIDSGIKSDPSLAQSSITVNVSETSIELNGTAASDTAKRNAERIAQSYANNRKVNNNIQVMGGNTGGMSQGQPSTNDSGTTTGSPDTNSTPADNPPVNQQPQAGSTR